jgi:hypothetical protein
MEHLRDSRIADGEMCLELEPNYFKILRFDSNDIIWLIVHFVLETHLPFCLQCAHPSRLTDAKD